MQNFIFFLVLFLVSSAPKIAKAACIIGVNCPKKPAKGKTGLLTPSIIKILQQKRGTIKLVKGGKVVAISTKKSVKVYWSNHGRYQLSISPPKGHEVSRVLDKKGRHLLSPYSQLLTNKDSITYKVIYRKSLSSQQLQKENQRLQKENQKLRRKLLLLRHVVKKMTGMNQKTLNMWKEALKD